MHTLTPAHRMPWTVASPFRMRPGLSRLVPATHAAAPPPLFLRDAQAPAYAARKQAVLQAIAAAYAAQTGVDLAPTAEALTQGLQEDIVVLHDEPDALRTRWLSVCFPSNWRPEEKIGLDFAAIHAPVADNALLQAGGKGIVDMAFRQASMLRHVWLLTPSADLAQHPETRRTRWEDAVAQADATGQCLLDQVFFRVERQTTLPLPALQRGVFFIRVMVCPLRAALQVAPTRAGELHAALASMSDAVVAYRGMGGVRPRLLAELAALSGP